ncbi:MAG TPA: hypothetical protein VMU04_06865 [Candidatus Acidoferrum sp.]|nr:hypothetical protein [Candidatus Acidoferrum sp.]
MGGQLLSPAPSQFYLGSALADTKTKEIPVARHVSLKDDRCRVRNTKGLWILGMLRRMAISLYTHWRERQPKPRSLWLTDFQAAMGEDNLAKAFAFVTHRRPNIT